jgi:hypothetical protein
MGGRNREELLRGKISPKCATLSRRDRRTDPFTEELVLNVIFAYPLTTYERRRGSQGEDSDGFVFHLSVWLV